MELLAGAFSGLALGVLLGWFIATARARAAAQDIIRQLEGRAAAAEAGAQELRAQIAPLRQEAGALEDALREAGSARAGAEARIAEMQRGFEQQRAMLDSDRERLSETFKALAAETLRVTNEDFSGWRPRGSAPSSNKPKPDSPAHRARSRASSNRYGNRSAASIGSCRRSKALAAKLMDN